MNHDAFSAGVEPGGLYSSQEIKILICYMLAGVNESLTRQSVLEILTADGMANFFEAGAAIDDLIRRQNLTEDETGLLHLTAEGRQAASTLSGMIPFTLRERSVKAALKLLTRMRREKENRVAVEKLEHGRLVTCEILDAGYPLLTFTLRVADDLQAGLIKERFLEDPTLVYSTLIALMTGDANWKRNGKRIEIDLP